jgi:sterol desaturase/sphingolipid hydroxylase (fatty acid hydroxylase superfamily)
MYVMAALVTGSVVYAGARAYHKHRRRRTTVWLFENGRAIETRATVVEEPDLAQIERRINRNLHLSTFSLGLAAGGVLIYAPLLLISMPLNFYNATMMFEDTWDMVLTKGPLGTVLVSSSVIAIILLIDLQVIAALVEWLYFLNQKLILLLMRSELGSVIMQHEQVRPVVGAYSP